MPYLSSVGPAFELETRFSDMLPYDTFDGYAYDVDSCDVTLDEADRPVSITYQGIVYPVQEYSARVWPVVEKNNRISDYLISTPRHVWVILHDRSGWVVVFRRDKNPDEQ